jgi:hypothetical protein
MENPFLQDKLALREEYKLRKRTEIWKRALV